MATSNTGMSSRYLHQEPHYYQSQSMGPPTAGSSSEGARYISDDEVPIQSRPREDAIRRVGGGRSGRRPGTESGAGPSLGFSIWKPKNKEKRNGKKKMITSDNTFDDEPQPQKARRKPAEQVVYRGQAGGARSGRGLSIPMPISRNDKSKSKIQGKAISNPIGSDEGSETGSLLSLGLGIPVEQWEQEMGITPLSRRTFNPETLRALRSSPIGPSPNLGTTSQGSSNLMALSPGSGLGTWSEEDEEENNIQGDSMESIRSTDHGSDETFRKYPPPHYSTIQVPDADPRVYSGTNRHGGIRPLPLRPESPMTSSSSNSLYSPQSSSPSSTITARAWPAPPTLTYTPSISSASSSSIPPTPPPMHPLDLYARSGRSKSPGPSQVIGLNPYPSTEVPRGTQRFGTKSESSLPALGRPIELSRPPGRNSDERGIVSGVVSGVDAAGRPYKYTYQYEAASGAPPSHEELMAALNPLRPPLAVPSSPPIPLPQQNFQPPNSPSFSQQQHTDHKPQHRSFPKRLIISGIGAPGSNDLHFDFDRALNEMHLHDNGEDKNDEGHQDDDSNDSDVDPAITKVDAVRRINQQQGRGKGGRRDGVIPPEHRQEPDREREEAVIQWCRGFGEVLEVRRRGQGCLMVEFVEESVVDLICRAQQVYIKGAGKVDLGWC